MLRLFVIVVLFFSLSFSAIAQKSELAQMTEEERMEFDYTFYEGVRAKITEDYRSALALFNRCMQINSGSAAVRYEISSILVLVDNNYDLPLKLMREAVRLEPDNIWYKLLLAAVYQKKSMIEEACRVYEELIRLHPENEELYFIEAELYLSVEKWAKAIAVMDRYEKYFGISEPVSIEKSKLYLQLGDFKNASVEIKNLIRQYPENQDYVGLLAELYLDNDQEKKGLKILNKMLNKDPDNSFILFYLTDYYYEKSDTLQGDYYLRKALLNDAGDGTFKVQYLIKLLVNSDRLKVSPEKIFQYVTEMREKYPEDIAVRTMYADLLKRQGRLKECQAELLFILDRDKYNYLIWEELMLLYNEMNNMTEMQSVAEDCIRYFPDEPLPYIMMGIPYLMENEYGKAVEVLEQGLGVALDGTPVKGQICSYLGDAYYHLDSVEMAFQMFDEAIKINPNDYVTLNNFSYYLSQAGIRLDEAERMSSKTVSVDPNNPTFLDTYAWILFKRGEYSLAKFYIRSAIDNNDEPSDVLYDHCGDILYMNEEKEEAVEMWKKALELKNGSDRNIEEKILHGIVDEKD